MVGNKPKRLNSKTGVSRKKKHAKFPKSEHFLPLSVSGGKKCSFFGKFGVLGFPETPVLRFALLSYYRPLVSLYFQKDIKCDYWSEMGHS